VGFAEEPGIAELVELGKKHQVPVIDDLGSGALIDLKRYGLETEPLIQTSLAASVDVACFSGDKLIGGPQSGIIVGRAAVVSQINKNPLMRALRVGKLTLAAMEATLKLFLNPDKINNTHPLYRMLSLNLGELERRAKKLAVRLLKALPEKAIFSVEDSGSQVGSGSVPVETIPTKVLAVRPLDISVDTLAGSLRLQEPPVFARIYKDYVIFDLRTIQSEEDVLVEKAILKTLGP
jgi:L-seryl-tRNA(Ser) seleniumtransferase